MVLAKPPWGGRGWKTRTALHSTAQFLQLTRCLLLQHQQFLPAPPGLMREFLEPLELSFHALVGTRIHPGGVSRRRGRSRGRWQGGEIGLGIAHALRLGLFQPDARFL